MSTIGRILWGGIAILVFLLSTGILNGVAENAWRPIGLANLAARVWTE